MTTRLALGTVQFGQPYGIANVSGQVGVAEVRAILQRAWEAGLRALDTAIAYGESEACLGRVGVTGWRVITKLPAVPPDVSNVHGWVVDQITGSLQRLGILQLDGVLLHKSSDLLGPKGRELAAACDALRSSGSSRAIGVSIYDTAELDALWQRWRPDIVQAPCNVLDRRLIHSGWLERLHQHGIRVHVRSVFLQGLLLMPAERRPAHFAAWTQILDRWLSWCAQQRSTPLECALAFARSLSAVEHVIVGVDSLTHLEQILRATSADVGVPPKDLFSEDRELLEPSRWKVA